MERQREVNMDNQDENELDKLTEAELEAGMPEETLPPELPPVIELPPALVPNEGISRPEITERTRELLRRGMGATMREGGLADRGIRRVLGAVPIGQGEPVADDGLSDLFEVPHPHDHDMETDDLFEVPDEHDNDMETDDLVEIPDEEDVFGGDLSDVFEVRNSDIIGKAPSRKGKNRITVRRITPATMRSMRY